MNSLSMAFKLPSILKPKKKSKSDPTTGVPVPRLETLDIHASRNTVTAPDTPSSPSTTASDACASESSPSPATPATAPMHHMHPVAPLQTISGSQTFMDTVTNNNTIHTNNNNVNSGNINSTITGDTTVIGFGEFHASSKYRIGRIGLVNGRQPYIY
ncbi:hypothetical protein BDZ97DRAFT_1781166 [Flammula alnicola]|nr:hypothetical protein BDZ97DRAFT_1781166 [Flammula alnicola]